MDIYGYLKRDHLKVRGLLENILSSAKSDQKSQTFEEMKNEVLIHSETEHETFYEALRQHKEIEQKIEHADKEHKEIENLLKQLSTMDMNSAEWLTKFKELKQSLEHHIKDEETEIFEQAKKLLSDEQAKQLAEDMDDLKQQTVTQ